MANITNSIDELTEMAVGVPHTEGRITYIEPNDIYGDVNGVPVTPEYSDFCISFILTAEVVQRTGKAALYTDEVINQESNHVLTYTISWNSAKDGGMNNVCFQQGTKYGSENYLTTYYTDINFADIKNSEGGIVEGLGVENVNVTFETYYAPTVKIRFIDVRGASLFGREEVIHTDNEITMDNIWGCFFTFPYPKFRLQIKGFYGKPITFQLSCTDFRANFNSQTGNFEIDTTFIGYDYGLIADIPTSYLMAAPYSQYVGKQYWENHVANDDSWTLSDGNKPNTLLFIADKIKKTLKTIQDESNNQNGGGVGDGAEDADRIAKAAILKELAEKYNAIITCLKGFNPRKGELLEVEEHHNVFFVSPGVRNLPTESENWKKLYTVTYDYVNTYKKFVENYQSDELSVDKKLIPPFFDNIKNDDNGMPIYSGSYGRTINEMGLYLYSSPYFYQNTISDTTIHCDDGYNRNFDVKISADRYDDVQQALLKIQEDVTLAQTYSRAYIPVGSRSSENTVTSYSPIGDLSLQSINSNIATYTGANLEIEPNHYNFFAVDLGNIYYLITSKLNSLSVDESNSLLSVSYDASNIDNYLANLDVFEAAGLLPTIRNLFKTIMCHLETFVQMVYQCYEKIMSQSNGDRSPEKLGIKGYEIDVNYDSGEGISVPPFPTIYVSESKVNTITGITDNVKSPGWLGYFQGETEWEERKLIEALALATQMFDNYQPSFPISDNATAVLYCTPDDLFTDVFPQGVFDVVNVPERLGCYLAMRASAMFGVIGYDVDQAKALGTADALNYYSKLQTKKKLGEIYGATTGSDLKSIIIKAATDNKNTSYPVILKSDEENRIYDNLLENTNASTYYEYRYTEKHFTDGGKQHRLGMVPVVQPTWESIRNGENVENKVFLKDNEFVNGCVSCTLTGEIGNGNTFISRKAYYRVPSQNAIDINNLKETVGENVRFINKTMFNIVEDDSVRNNLKRFVDAAAESNETETSMLSVGDYSFNFSSDDYKDLRDFVGCYWNMIPSKNYVLKNQDPIEVCGVSLKVERFKIRDINGLNFIFNSPIYYLQNKSVDLNDPASDKRKCLLFLITSGYEISTIYDMLAHHDKFNTVCEQLPKGALLTIGGLLWNWSGNEYKEKGRLYFENPPYLNGNKQYLIIQKDKSSSIWFPYIFTDNLSSANNFYKKLISNDDFDRATRDFLINYFENFANSNEWGNIRDKYELKNETNGRTSTIDNLQKHEYTEEDEEILSSVLDKEVLATWGTMKKLDANNKHIEVSKGAFEAYVSAFCSQLDTIHKGYQPEQTDEFVLREDMEDKDIKLAMYMYIKNLWDRWLMSYRDRKEYFNVENFMGNFVFIDSLYRNVGDMIHINCEKLLNYLTDVNGKSMLYQLLASICNEHKCHFFALPDYFNLGEQRDGVQTDENVDYREKIKDMFTPIPYSEKGVLETSNKFIVMLVYNQSENITNYNDFSSTSFDIWSHDGNMLIVPDTFKTDAISQELSESGSVEEIRMKRYGYPIPSFGIAFGRINNAIFKNVNVGMTNPIATEQSIDALSLIAQRGGGNDKSVVFYGQDLFPVFTGYSYTCSVDMMGCAQIMPLMYCQLMNIPMFRGTYMIYSVTHTMKPGDMTTSFKAMKLSKNALPFADKWFTSVKYVLDSEGNLVPYGCGGGGGDTYIANIVSGARVHHSERINFVTNGRGITRTKAGDPKTWTDTLVGDYPLHYWNENGNEVTVKYTINHKIAAQLQKIFENIFAMVDHTYGDENGHIRIKSINTYNYRGVIGADGHQQDKRSNHCYGVAIDINGNDNWWNAGGGSTMYKFRSTNHPIVKEFITNGNGHEDWDWGGLWHSGKDWMHFCYIAG